MLLHMKKKATYPPTAIGRPAAHPCKVALDAPYQSVAPHINNASHTQESPTWGDVAKSWFTPTSLVLAFNGLCGAVAMLIHHPSKHVAYYAIIACTACGAVEIVRGRSGKLVTRLLSKLRIPFMRESRDKKTARQHELD